MPPRKRLGQLLTELGVVDEHQLQSALGHQKQWGGKLGAILVQKNFCKEDDVVSALSKHLGMPAVKLSQAKVDERAVKFVSKQIAEKLHVFPYEVSGSGRGESVTIAMSDPTDLSAVDQLAFHTGKRIKPMLAGDSEIISAIQQHYGSAEEKKEPTEKMAQPGASAAASRSSGPFTAVPPPAASKSGPFTAVPPPAASRSGPFTAVPPVAASRSGPFTAVPPVAAPPSRRIDPQLATTPAGGSPRVAPYVPPPIPATPARPVQKLEEIEPDESMATPTPPPPPKPEPLDLPESEDDGSGQMMGLEPIAAHTQVEDVSGSEELAGEGSAADAVEGLETASVPHEGAAEAQKMEGLEPVAAHSQPPVWESPPPLGEGWETQPAAPAWDEAAATAETAGWTDTEPAKPAEPAAPAEPEGWATEETPPVAPAAAEFGAAQDWSTSETWDAGGEQPPEAPSEQLPADAIIGTAEAPAESAAESPADSPWGGEEQGAAAEAEHAMAAEQETAAAVEQAVSSEQGPAAVAEQEPAPSMDHEAAPAPEADAPDAWASSEDPLAAQVAASEAAAWGDAAQSVEAAWSETPADAETPAEAEAPAETEAPAEAEPQADAEAAAAAETPAPAAVESVEAPEPLAETEAPPEWGAAEETPAPAEEAPAPAGEASAFAEEPAAPAEEAAAPAEETPAPPEDEPAAAEAPAAETPTEFSEEKGELKLEGWIAPPPEPEPEGAGWIGAALEATAPLSPADLGTLASVGVDPNDGVAALRLLAALVRILNRRQLLDLDEVAAEIRDSRAQGAAAAAEAPVDENGAPEASAVEQTETADT